MRAFWNINIISLWNSLVVRMVCKNNIAVSISAWERIWNYQLGARFAWLYTLRLETPYPVFNALFYWREIHRSAWEDGKHTSYNKSEHRQSTANKSRDRQLKDRAKAISGRERVSSKGLSSSIQIFLQYFTTSTHSLVPILHRFLPVASFGFGPNFIDHAACVYAPSIAVFVLAFEQALRWLFSTEFYCRLFAC